MVFAQSESPGGSRRSSVMTHTHATALLSPSFQAALSHTGRKNSDALGHSQLGHSSQAALVAASPAEPTFIATPVQAKPLHHVLSEAGNKALGGGIPGMAAMATQVLALMWMRTTVNYQYRHGTDTGTALRTLYREGGVRRFYRGLLPALVQAPLSRFGDTAANAGTLALLENYEATRGLPLGVKTLLSSTAAGLFRIGLMPVDTVKTMMQVEGQGALTHLAAKVRAGGPWVVYHGALASSAATFVGHYPWFVTYNYLNALLPQAPSDDLPRKLGRSALLGFCSQFASDCCSNGVRVIKNNKQTSREATTYSQVTRAIIQKDGVLGLMGRGLKTKLVSNGVQGIFFTILWRLGQDWWEDHHMSKAPDAAVTAGNATSPTAAIAAAASTAEGVDISDTGGGTLRMLEATAAGSGPEPADGAVQR